jgi:hypothetical protein
MLAILQQKVVVGVKVTQEGDQIIFEAAGVEAQQFRCGEIPTEIRSIDLVKRVIYDLSQKREVYGRLAHVGLRYTDIALAQAGLR